MGKQLRWSADDLRKKGLVQNEKGDFVKVSSLAAKGKVEKLPSLVERMATAQASIEESNRKIRKAISDLPNKGMNPDTEPSKMITKVQAITAYFDDQDRQLNNKIEFKKPGAYDGSKHSAIKFDEYGLIEKPDSDLSFQEMRKIFNETGFLITNTNPKNPFLLPSGEIIDVKFDFDLAPFPAPRMTRGDKWKTDPYHPDPTRRQRKCVFEYFAWRDAFQAMSAHKGFMLDERLHAVCITPFPESYSRKKRETLLNQYHKQRPDADNFGKSIMDSFKVDDGYVCDLRIVKLWGPIGRILIF